MASGFRCFPAMSAHTQTTLVRKILCLLWLQDHLSTSRNLRANSITLEKSQNVFSPSLEWTIPYRHPLSFALKPAVRKVQIRPEARLSQGSGAETVNSPATRREAPRRSTAGLQCGWSLVPCGGALSSSSAQTFMRNQLMRHLVLWGLQNSHFLDIQCPTRHCQGMPHLIHMEDRREE